MTGPYDGVIGVQKEQIIHRFLTGLPGRFEAAKGDPRFCGVVIECDPETGKASAIQRVMLGEYVKQDQSQDLKHGGNGGKNLRKKKRNSCLSAFPCLHSSDSSDFIPPLPRCFRF